MNGSYSQFKAAQQRQMERRAKTNNSFNTSANFKSKIEKTEYNFPELPLYQLRIVQKNIQKQKRKEHLLQSIVYWIIMVSISLLVLKHL